MEMEMNRWWWRVEKDVEEELVFNRNLDFTFKG
jgi:hypothetical protein